MRICKLVVFCALLSLPFRVGLAKEVNPIYFEALTSKAISKYQLNDTAIAEIKHNMLTRDLVDTLDILISKVDDTYLILQKNNLNCGSAACTPIAFQKRNDKLVFGDYRESENNFDCSLEGDLVKCFIVHNKFYFTPLPKLINAEGTKNPFIDDHYGFVMFLDLKDDCYTHKGCSTYNAKIEHDKVVIGKPYYDVSCYHPDDKGVLICLVKDYFWINVESNIYHNKK